jgi:hypothetical protein
MGRRDKLIARFNGRPKDFTWDEMVRLREGFGYHEAKAGKTGGSPGFTHQLRRLLIDDRVGRFPFGATGDERHDRGFGGVLHGA